MPPVREAIFLKSLSYRSKGRVFRPVKINERPLEVHIRRSTIHESLPVYRDPLFLAVLNLLNRTQIHYGRHPEAPGSE